MGKSFDIFGEVVDYTCPREDYPVSYSFCCSPKSDEGHCCPSLSTNYTAEVKEMLEKGAVETTHTVTVILIYLLLATGILLFCVCCSLCCCFCCPFCYLAKWNKKRAMQPRADQSEAAPMNPV